MEALTLQDSKRLVQLEKVIKDGQDTFMEVGQALAEIRDKRLYRADYKTFVDYLDKVWNIGKSQGYRLIDASEAAKSVAQATMSPLGGQISQAKVPYNAAVALSKVPPPRRASVVQKIVSAGQKVTAAAINKLAPPARKPTTALLDGTGLEIPLEAIPMWNRKGEAQVLLSMVSDLRGILKKAQEEKDPLFNEVDFTDSLAKLNQVYVDLQRAKPYAVCATCNGVKSDGCEVCNGRGFVSEFYWKNCVPEETKQLTGRK